MIYNKSNHPIEVKKISVRIWSLRDEIEASLSRRMKECEAAGVPLYIEDIKNFYDLNDPSKDNVILLKAKDDEMTSLMEELSEDVPSPKEKTAEVIANDPPLEAAPVEGSPAVDDEKLQTVPGENKTLKSAEEIIAEQALAGLETKKPNPILERPYTRQAPDLERITYGFILLSDITMDQMLVFTKDKFLHGQCVIVEFLIPQNFMMTANVAYCHNYAMRSRIISSTKPDFRLQLKFSFTIKGERDTLRSFLKSIEPTVPKEVKKPKSEIEDDLGI